MVLYSVTSIFDFLFSAAQLKGKLYVRLLPLKLSVTLFSPISLLTVTLSNFIPIVLDLTLPLDILAYTVAGTNEVDPPPIIEILGVLV